MKEEKELTPEEKERNDESNYYEELMKTELHMKGEIIGDENEEVIVIGTSREMILIKQHEDGKYSLLKKIPLILLKKVSMKKSMPGVLSFNGVPPHLPLTVKFEKVNEFLQFLKSKNSKKGE